MQDTSHADKCDRVILGWTVAFSVGQIVGDYRVLGTIGSGGMGTVYKVQHLISERIEALKVVLPDLSESAELASRFMREIKVQASLTHPNIAALHNALRFENELLMVMEYVEGINLSTRLHQGKIEVSISLEIVLQVLSALAYAHSQGVIHRDIKPANIMVARAGVVKLMDFGIARSSADQQLTQAGAAIGSVYYMSPEQVQGSAVDGRSDLYSVGIMLYEMVTGVKPIAGESSWAVMNGHLHQVPRSPAALEPNLPPALALTILRAIEKNPQDRFQSAAEFSEMLKAALRRNPAMRINAPNADSASGEITVFQALQGKPEAERVQRSTSPASDPVATPAIPPEQRHPLFSTPSRTPWRDPSETPVSGATPVSKTSRFSAEELERVKRDLAEYVGPLAKVLVSRSAKKANDLKDLYQILAMEVPTGAERQSFLQKRPR